MKGEEESTRPPLGSRREALRRHHRFTPVLVIVLIVLTLLNGYALLLGIELVTEEVEHGGDIADLELQLGMLALVESVVSVGALAGVWLRRVRGVYVYLAAKVLTLVFGFALAAEYVTLPVVLPLALGGVLWWAANSAGWRLDGWAR
ncbi:hypothetical protein [Amycolatopsis cihanbeyliensis]|uniref:DoxX-like protein n=1 Tax=Amycolatopsis cihanbeyliensis TaxID=1128664 RepID=A0A542DSC9_AMYCI|nr:hypothetical protein [Amycolatopsis cihanbeyliensis]TQJ05886.1 hypothetical protein FB471_5731 [Amycolatopsis cihanbeyliensis]